jgi:hypothetical protein
MDESTMVAAPTTHSTDGKLGRFWLPLAWVVLVMALSVRFLWQAWPALNDYRLPGAARFLIEAEMIAAAITLLAGLFVLAMGLARSHLFPWAFLLWQGFDILVMAASTVYTLTQPDFIMTPLSFLIVGIQALIGVGLVFLIFESPERGVVFAARARQGMPIFARIVCCLLGIVVGGFVGFWVGLAIGAGISEATNMSCFEGACGFFVFFIGLAGLLLGAIGGGIGVALWTRRRAD